MSFVLLLIAAMLLLDVLWLVAGVRLLRRAQWKGGAAVAHTLFVGLQVAGLVVVLLSRRAEFPFDLTGAQAAAVYVWHVLILPVIAPLLLIGGGIRAIARGLKRLRKEPAARQVHIRQLSQGPVMDRRSFLATAAVLAPPVFSVGLTGIALRQLDEFRIRRFTIALPDLPAALDGATIAHVSDMHVGRFTSGEVLRKMTAAVNDLRADIVLLTGDMINSSLDELPEAIDTIRRLDATAGVYSIEGNHDLFDGREEFEARVKASGLPLLVNETARVTIRGYPVDLLGLRWGAPGVSGPRPRSSDPGIRASLAELLGERDADAFPILLAHHPHAFDSAIEAGLPLTLAGHTHGGQLMLNSETGFGPMMFRYWSGLYSRGGSHLIVSNGVGNWFPLRTSAPAEIIHVTLQRG